MKLAEFDFKSAKTYEFEPDLSDVKQKRRFYYEPSESFSFPSAAKCLFERDGEVYLLDTDGFLYKRRPDGTGFRMVSMTQFGLTIKFLPIVKDGEKAVIVVTPDTAEVARNASGTEISVPYGILRFYAGRIFSASGKTVFYSGLYDFTSFDPNIGGGGFIELEEDDGDIVGIEELSGKLYIFCKNSLFSLTAFGEPTDFKLEKLSFPRLTPDENSVLKVDSNVYFLSGNILKKFDGKTVKTASLSLVGKTLTGEAESFSGMYVRTITGEDGNYSFVYEDATGEEAFVKIPTNAECNGAITPQRASGKILRLTGETVGVDLYSVEGADFGTSAIKTVLAADVGATGTATLLIKGESGTVKRKIKNGGSYVKFCASGRFFDLSFTDCSEDFSINRLKLIYSKCGG